MVYAIALIAILTVLPLRLWHEPIESTSNRIEEGKVTLEKGGPYVEQMFVAQYDLLSGIDVQIASCDADTYYEMRVYDEYYNLLRTQTACANELDLNTGRSYVHLNLRTEVGKQYYYRLECMSGSMTLVYEFTESSGFIYNGPCHVGEEAIGGCNLITGYKYTQPLRKTKSLLAILVIAALAFAMTALLKLIYKKTGKLSDVVTLQWGVKAICNPLIIVGTVGGMIATGPLYLFSLQYFDIGIFTLGTLMFGITLWVAVNRTYGRNDAPRNWEHLMDKLPDLLQAICFAMGIQACIHYMNGLYNIHHDIAYRQMLIWLALSMIVTFKRKELINWQNLAGIVVSAALAFRYYKLHLPEATMDLQVQVLKLSCILAVFITLAAIHIVTILLQRKVRHVNVLYFAATCVMAAGIIIKRNTRWWPVMMVIAFTVYALHYAAWDKKERLLNNVLNGILLNFLGCTAFCLWHRPFMSFNFTRYPHIFHTVTETAAYLAVIMAAALVKLLWKYNKEENWKACFWELVIFGVSSCYELFTMSRTGLIAVVAMGLVVWFVMIQGKMKQKAKKLLYSAIMLVLSVLWFFPISFTAQRIVPALTKQPVVYEVEMPDVVEQVLVADDIQSDTYITLDRFWEVFANKMFSVPTDTFNLYQYRIGPDYTKIQEDGGGNKRPMPGVLVRDDGGKETEEDFSNGRTDIYKSYIEQMTMEGHDEMGAVLQDGSIAVHAHDIYLQFAFDHGIIMGILFVLWLLATGIQSLIYFYRKKEENPAAALPLALITLFCVAGLVEWIAHPMNPAGFCVLLALAPLLFDNMKTKKEK